MISGVGSANILCLCRFVNVLNCLHELVCYEPERGSAFGEQGFADHVCCGYVRIVCLRASTGGCSCAQYDATSN